MPKKQTSSNRRSHSFLPEEIKRFIIMLCARWERPTAIAKMVKGQFGIDVSPQAMEGYDPMKRVGRNLSRPHQELFFAERERFTREIDAIPIAHAAYRIGKLQQYAEWAEQSGELGLAMAALKQAAQDLGGQFTNNVNVSETITKAPVDLSHLDSDERDALQHLLDLTEPESDGRAGLPSVRQEGVEHVCVGSVTPPVTRNGDCNAA
jgi:hypothetical protein